MSKQRIANILYHGIGGLTLTLLALILIALIISYPEVLIAVAVVAAYFTFLWANENR